VTTFLDGRTGGKADTYVFAISGLSLIVTAITAPEGLTGLVRRIPTFGVASGSPATTGNAKVEPGGDA
jgi:hypothetical protein